MCKCNSVKNMMKKVNLYEEIAIKKIVTHNTVKANSFSKKKKKMNLINRKISA